MPGEAPLAAPVREARSAGHGGTVSVAFVGAGNCTINANQGGDASYAPAPLMQQTFAVNASEAPTVSCVLARQVEVVGDTVGLDLSLLFAPPANDTLSYSATTGRIVLRQEVHKDDAFEGYKPKAEVFLTAYTVVLLAGATGLVIRRDVA